MKEYLQILADGETLSRPQAEAAMHVMMSGDAEPVTTAALLVGLRSRGETLDELTGFTHVMRAYAVPVACDDPHAIDLCGTGGDDAGTFNISTTASFVCAGAGVTVAKHGNRSVSSTCGSADVLEALGVRIDLRKHGVEHCLREAGIAFLFAPYFHPAMRHVMPVRRKLGVRTFFNILGPLCNPAGVTRQLVGAFDTQTARVMADILAALDAQHVCAVHARDGLDEVSLAAPTALFEYDASAGDSRPEGAAFGRGHVIQPEDHGVSPLPLDRLRGGTLEKNAAILTDVLKGVRGPHRDVTLLNAAYALHASDRFDGIDACFAAARESIDGGHALAKLEALVEASQDAPAD